MTSSKQLTQTHHRILEREILRGQKIQQGLVLGAINQFKLIFLRLLPAALACACLHGHCQIKVTHRRGGGGVVSFEFNGFNLVEFENKGGFVDEDEGLGQRI